MKICAAQTKPVKGNIGLNLQDHLRLIELALAEQADIIVFPELSLTGYEPELAAELATDLPDPRFDILQRTSDAGGITICAGMPVRSGNGTLISMLIFQPHKDLQVYSKQHLHEDEFPYFIESKSPAFLVDNTVSFAICYELSVPDHAQYAHRIGTRVYIASVAKTESGIEKASDQLSAIANANSMTVILSNCTGPCDNFISAGQSSIWDNKGRLLARLGAEDTGILLIDLSTGETSRKIMASQS